MESKRILAGLTVAITTVCIPVGDASATTTPNQWFTTAGATYVPALAPAAAQYAATGSVGAIEGYDVLAVASAEGGTASEAITQLGPPPSSANLGAAAVVAVGDKFVAGVVLARIVEAAPASTTTSTMPAPTTTATPATVSAPGTIPTTPAPTAVVPAASAAVPIAVENAATTAVSDTLVPTSTMREETTSTAPTTADRITGGDATIESSVVPLQATSPDAPLQSGIPSVAVLIALLGFGGLCFELGRRRTTH